MKKVSFYNQQGEKIGETLLPKEIFETNLNTDLLHQVVVAQMANRRRVIAHTKNRGEVRGGGKKPWRQKGTGRARHGSIRSPIWKGGGVVFGPRKERVFKKRIPDKMKNKALFMALSAKAEKDLLFVIDDLKVEKKKTKLIKDILNKIFKKRESVLIVIPSYDKNIIFSARNIPKTKVMQAKDLNTLDLLSFKYLLITKESLKVIKDVFLKNKKGNKKK